MPPLPSGNTQCIVSVGPKWISRPSGASSRNGCQIVIYPGSLVTVFQLMPVSRLQPLAWSHRCDVPQPPLPLAVETRPLGRATLVLYRRGSFMSGVRVQVLLRQSKMLERTVVLRPPFTSTRPSGSITSAPQNMSCEG